MSRPGSCFAGAGRGPAGAELWGHLAPGDQGKQVCYPYQSGLPPIYARPGRGVCFGRVEPGEPESWDVG